MSSRELRLTRRAERDLDSILSYTRWYWGQEKHAECAAALNHTFELLLEYPEIGKERPEAFPGARSFPCEKHVIYYRLQADAIHIVAILHQRMDTREAFRKKP